MDITQQIVKNRLNKNGYKENALSVNFSLQQHKISRRPFTKGRNLKNFSISAEEMNNSLPNFKDNVLNSKYQKGNLRNLHSRQDNKRSLDCRDRGSINERRSMEKYLKISSDFKKLSKADKFSFKKKNRFLYPNKKALLGFFKQMKIKKKYNVQRLYKMNEKTVNMKTHLNPILKEHKITDKIQKNLALYI